MSLSPTSCSNQSQRQSQNQEGLPLNVHTSESHSLFEIPCFNSSAVNSSMTLHCHMKYLLLLRYKLEIMQMTYVSLPFKWRNYLKKNYWCANDSFKIS